ncbi:hypothetical protein [Spirosoma fluviale]|nr:hypothetical protein [Spirosoma fluviale]
MKRYVLLMALFLPVYGFAQSSPDAHQQDLLGQGHIMVGVNAGGGYGSGPGTVAHTTPRIQYFLKDGWSVAAEGRYVNIGPHFRYFGGGLSTRYYFLRSTRFAMFGQVGANYGQRSYGRREPTNPYQTLSGFKGTAWQVNAGLGAHYRVGNRWSIEAMVEGTQFQKAYLSPYNSGWQGSIGVNFRIK